MTKPEPLLRTTQVAELLGVSPKTVTRLVNENGLPVAEETPIGGHRRYRWSQVKMWRDAKLAEREANRENRRERMRATRMGRAKTNGSEP